VFPVYKIVHTVIETPAFLTSARELGLEDDERAKIVTHLAYHPEAGDLMPGTGGARKLRFIGRGKGKSGGFRVITFFAGSDIPVFLLDVFGKGDKANLRKAERNELRRVLTALPQKWREQASRRAQMLRRTRI
jgi:hypothetical protein